MKLLTSITDNKGNFNESTLEGTKFMLKYHEIDNPDSILLIQETTNT